MLLQNDKLITRISVETDTLLEPPSEFGDNDSRVVIAVKIRPYNVRADNMGFS